MHTPNQNSWFIFWAILKHVRVVTVPTTNDPALPCVSFRLIVSIIVEPCELDSLNLHDSCGLVLLNLYSCILFWFHINEWRPKWNYVVSQFILFIPGFPRWGGHLDDQETFSITVNSGNTCYATAQAKLKEATKYMVKKIIYVLPGKCSPNNTMQNKKACWIAWRLSTGPYTQFPTCLGFRLCTLSCMNDYWKEILRKLSEISVWRSDKNCAYFVAQGQFQISSAVFVVQNVLFALLT